MLNPIIYMIFNGYGLKELKKKFGKSSNQLETQIQLNKRL
jgi:hypothetical protein